MKEIFAFIVMAALVIIALVGLAFGGYYATAYFAPKYEAVRRDVMIESRYYSEASVRELYRLKAQHDMARTPEEKATIIAAARHEFSIFPEDRLPADLYGWMASIK